jgi:hypothetical protein
VLCSSNDSCPKADFVGPIIGGGIGGAFGSLIVLGLTIFIHKRGVEFLQAAKKNGGAL